MWSSAVGRIVLLILGLLLAPLAAHAQPPAKVPRIGILWALRRSCGGLVGATELGPNIARLSFGATAGAFPSKSLCRKHSFSAK